MPVHIFHLKVTGAKNFGRMKEVIALVEAARARGVRVSADQYPYVASSTSLTATIPDWAEEGGTDKADRAAEGSGDARADPPRDGGSESDLGEPLSVRRHLAEHPARVHRPDARRRRHQQDPNRQYEGMRIAEAAKKAGKDPFDFVFDLLVEERGSVGCVYFIMSEDDLKLAHEAAVGRRRIGRLGARD